jgi:uncharacterized protein (TIGR02646 family)
MIHVARDAPPGKLQGPESSGERERARAIAYYANAVNTAKSFPFAVYKDESIKDALRALFHGKCAYCEVLYEASQPVDVEHYRPKGGYVQAGNLQTPGYYWLAADWTNLLPSCIDCNRERHQQFAREPEHLSGKANKFPLADEQHRAQQPGEEQNETPLLIDPCQERPERHLRFLDDGYVDPATEETGLPSEKGRESIAVYGLDRDGIVRARRETLMKLKIVMRDIERFGELLERYPREQGIVDDLARKREELARYAEPQHPFAGACRQVIARFEKDKYGSEAVTERYAA